MQKHRSFASAFTLIELLVSLAVVGILSTVVVVAINPGELLKQSRDATRLSDMNAISTAIGIYAADQSGSSLGVASTTYLSLADSTTTCANLGLPPLTNGWSYHCSPSSTLQKIDGTGWLPMNFTAISSGAPLAVLPADPVNSTSTASYYYSLVTGVGGTYKVSSAMESQKQSSKSWADGGNDPLRYELASNNSLRMPGPVLWLKADEITGLNNDDPIATWSDSSGNGYDATQATGSNQPLYKVGQLNGKPIVFFDGTSDSLFNTSFTAMANLTGRTIFFVSKSRTVTGPKITFADGETASNNAFGLQLGEDNTGYDAIGGPYGGFSYTTTNYTVVTSLYDGGKAGNANRLKVFLNGSQQTISFNGTIPAAIGASPSAYYIARRSTAESHFANTNVAEIMIYNYALTDAARQQVERYLNDKYALY